MKFAVRIIRNAFYPIKCNNINELHHDQMVLVETEKGVEVHKLILVNDEILKQWQKSKPEPLQLVRVMTENDKKQYEEQLQLEYRALGKCRYLAEKRNLTMNLTKAKYTFDRKKITFYYTAPERVDFRELLKDLTQEFKFVRIDLRHIGVRDETAILQGEGICGNNYCCARFLRKFEQINTKFARNQGLPISTNKITGSCGRLLCCLNYEHQNYLENAKDMAPIGSSVMTPDGVGKVCLTNVLYKKLSVKFEDGKIKEFKNNEVEIIDREVNIQIDNVRNSYTDDENIDIKALEDERGSSTGNI